MKAPKILTLIIYLIATSILNAQNQKYSYEIGLITGGSNTENSSFWQQADKFGLIPEGNFGMISSSFSKRDKKDSNWGWSAGVSLSAYVSRENKFVPNEYYLEGRYKKWKLTIGAQNNEINYSDLSSSNGNIAMSTNARAIPGIILATNDYVQIFKNKPNFKFMGYFGEFLLNDSRVTEGLRLHRAGFDFLFRATKINRFSIGMHDYAQWGGISPVYGDMNYGFENYLRMIFMLPGGMKSPLQDQENVSGSHLGTYQLKYIHDKEIYLEFYISHLFEDGSGMGWQNWPDNLYGVYIDFKNKNRFIEKLNYEITYTGNTSGKTRHDQGGGQDNYFNNTIYPSGWTYFGRSIGSPYFPVTIDEKGISQGIELGYNRFFATNFSSKGHITENIPYSFRTSYVHYIGKHGSEFSSKPYNIGFLLETDWSKLIPNRIVDIKIGISSDIGSFYSNNFSGFISISKKGLF